MMCDSAFGVAGVGLCGTRAKLARGALIDSSPLSMGKSEKR